MLARGALQLDVQLQRAIGYVEGPLEYAYTFSFSQ